MDFRSRFEILDSIKGVVLVDSVDDGDGTVCDAIKRHKPTYFANGGQRGKDNTPEVMLCKELGVELLWGVGGDEIYGGAAAASRRLNNDDVPPVRTVTKYSER